MIVAASFMMMLASAPSADPVGTGRRDFSKCLGAQMQPALNRKMPLGEFQSTLKQTCAAQESAFRAAIIAQDKADGMSDAEASADADDQIAEYIDKITSEYEENSQPG